MIILYILFLLLSFCNILAITFYRLLYVLTLLFTFYKNHKMTTVKTIMMF